MLITEKLDVLLKSFVGNGLPGNALVVKQRGKILYEGYFGYMDIKAGKPVDADTIYRICSMTKVITCVAALILYERGLYLLNDKLSDYLPEYSDMNVIRYLPNGNTEIVKASNNIRIKDLFAMTSGLTYPGDKSEASRRTSVLVGDLNNKYKQGGKGALCIFASELSRLPLAFEPGTHWEYGFSHDILGALVEALSGKTFGRFLEEELFEPLRMKDTFFKIPEDKKPRLAKLYKKLEDGSLTESIEIDKSYYMDEPLESGGGGLLSTIGDYSAFAEMLADGGGKNGKRILGSSTIKLMGTNLMNEAQMRDIDWPALAGYGYGLGVRVMADPPAGGSNSNVGEFGWSGYAGTWTLIDTNLGLSAVYMQQQDPNLEEVHHPRLRSVIYGSI